MLRQALVSRQLTASLAKALKSSLVKVISGPRRAGKSTLAFQVLAPHRFGYLNFEDDSLYDELPSDTLIEALQDVYGKTDFLFFDEIQNYPHWESFINKLHRRGHNLVITGSNSRLLSRELGSALTGRHIAFQLLPFSFVEYKAAQKAEAQAGNLLFDRYLQWGGFPEIALGKSEPHNYLSTLFDSIVLRDIVTRHHVRASTAIYDLLSLLINNAANRFTARSLDRSLDQLSTATIQKFIAYSREAYLIQDLQPYFFKPKKRLKADRKVYAFDNGFISAKSQPATSTQSRLLENLVFIELVRRGYVPNNQLFYYETNLGHEVDFLVRQGSRNEELIQVTQHLSSLKTREREIRALLQAAEELRVQRLTVITLRDSESIQEQGHRIRVISCDQWLQGNSST